MGIENRKAEAKVQFLDAQGKPLANTKIDVNQTNHEFLFGCGAFDFVQFANPPKSEEEKMPWFKTVEDQVKLYNTRVEKWLGLFNYGTLPFYWGNFEKEEGKPNTEGLMNAAKFMKEKGIVIKGHPLFWHTSHAPWLLKYDNAKIMEIALNRIQREVEGFKGIIDMWDVINEVVIMPIYEKYDNYATRVCQEKGRIGLCKELFNQAYKYNPDGTFLINDFNLSTSYEILIDGLLQSGVPVNTIGLQTHQHHGVFGKEKIEEILSRFEHFGLPIHFTENTIVAGPKVPPEIIDLQDAHYDDDAATPELELMQADELEKMYRNLFENHPLVTAITNWDFSDGMWLNAPSGFIRKDCSIKPAYERLHKLIKEEWHTAETVTTDANGFATVSGFRGTYEACAAGKKAEFKLNAQTPAKIQLG